MDARNCLLYDPHASSGQILALINDAGWRVTRIDAAQPAYLHKTEDGRGVGLAVIGARALADGLPVQRLIAQSPCRPWVALLEPEVTLTQDLLHLLGTYFEDYQVLPVSPERLGFTLYRAGVRHAHLPGAGQARVLWPELILQGSSPPALRLQADVERAAESDSPVWIEGPPGSGKAMTARAIHRRSWRSLAPFVPFTCLAGAAADDIRAELFGVGETRAASGSAMRRGRIDSAQVGVLFLDGVDVLPLAVQQDLLQLLQKRVFRRRGGEDFIPVDVRIMVASGGDLDRAVADGDFLPALRNEFARLRIGVPGLSARAEDVESLARASLRQQFPGTAFAFAPATLALLPRHDWPGNLRELINRIARAVLVADGATLLPEHLGLGEASAAPPRRPGVMRLGAAKAQAERAVVVSALVEAGHNISQAARLLGVSRMTLYRLMDKHGIREDTRTLAE
ncbi:sigma-54 dependent transcriptional regulator [Methyloparacoccus murrellii]